MRDEQSDVFDNGPRVVSDSEDATTYAMAALIPKIKERLALRAKVPIVAIALEVALVSVETTGKLRYWVMDCPVCSNENRLTLVADDTFQCAACGTTGDVFDLYRLFVRGASYEDALQYVERWLSANPKGPSVNFMTLYAAHGVRESF